MAVVVGESGAWRQVVAVLAQCGVAVSRPHELFPLIAELEKSKPQLIGAHHERMMLAVQMRESLIAKLASESGLLRRIINWFRIQKLKAQNLAAHREHSKYSLALDRRISNVRAVIDSVELVGAEAELAVIDRLRLLPHPVVVFNDVQLRATRHIMFEDVPLVSAQIDHVVLTTAGVFAIETKRWSERFVRSGEFYDPFEQASRANYLCYDLLRASFGKTPVRSIIANVGSLPTPPRDSYIKVLKPDHLNGYISGFRSAELTPERFGAICHFFESRVNRSSSMAVLRSNRQHSTNQHAL